MNGNNGWAPSQGPRVHRTTREGQHHGALSGHQSEGPATTMQYQGAALSGGRGRLTN